ncbi:hypothetical protein CC85DRAFT_284575 [Cutaneotrichosporon oleaginosum]|uniref:Non-structural maintenance of chromosomes element 1 homolog n=1 Tax=Cutaneotrichosporon oleaginosum TaxID=879819 RepID=A0A0J1B6U2_9TREE|nr:uncharacterized protein CC85DRAFT_284575 [Cutaneotrichosporon oleaginosum]KLT43434.1 hypothetical protein CC85DRAFT_284575 [Cutaneotrichosporon oleaginosum]TXT05353.1 hypothetical protein COLE_06673 [Cutaneotrichosporon oleaginosum]
MPNVAATDLHRAFNQMLLSRRAMTDDRLLEMYRRTIKAVQASDQDFQPTHRSNEQGLNAFLEELTSLLEPLGLGLKRGADETSGRKWTALVNTEGAGEIAQQATDLSPLEISYVRAVIEAIVESYPANSVGSRHAVGLVKDLNGQMTQSAAQALLKALVARGWLATSERGRYSLAPRAMLELADYLRGEYDDYVRVCRRCNRIVMTGVACAHQACEAHYHGYCYDMVLERRTACLECKTSFEEVRPTPIGEKAVSRVQDDFARAAKRRRSQRGNEDDEVDDSQPGMSQEQRAVAEEDEVESEEERRPSRSQGRTQQRGAETIIPDSFVDPDEEDLDSQPGPSRRRFR